MFGQYENGPSTIGQRLAGAPAEMAPSGDARNEFGALQFKEASARARDLI